MSRMDSLTLNDDMPTCLLRAPGAPIKEHPYLLQI